MRFYAVSRNQTLKTVHLKPADQYRNHEYLWRPRKATIYKTYSVRIKCAHTAQESPRPALAVKANSIGPRPQRGSFPLDHDGRYILSVLCNPFMPLTNGVTLFRRVQVCHDRLSSMHEEGSWRERARVSRSSQVISILPNGPVTNLPKLKTLLHYPLTCILGT